jgi:lipoprotein-anchoring transpeptidase ErfK/SrfK
VRFRRPRPRRSRAPAPRGIGRAASEWAPVRRRAEARRRPAATAEAVAALPLRTPEGTQNLVRVLGRRHVVFRGRVGVGRDVWPTPHGEFYVRNRLERFASPTYGPLAYGSSARSATLTDWPAGGYVGIHGTDRPDLLPGRVSHGCIRLRNRDIRRLGRLMPVGTPVRIR